MKVPIKRILLFLLPFSVGVGVLMVVVGTQDLVSPLPKLGPSTDPRSGEAKTSSALGATISGPATMKGVTYIEPKTLEDGTQVTHYRVHLGKAEISKLSPSLSDLSDSTGALSEDPELTLYNQKPPPEERQVAKVTARWGRAVPYERKEDDPTTDTHLREIHFQESVVATIFDPSGNHFQVHTESLRVIQVSPNRNDPKFEVSSDTHVLLTKQQGGLRVEAEGFLFQIALGLLTLQPPVHAEGMDFSLPALDDSTPRQAKVVAVPVVIDCKGKAFFHRLDEDMPPTSATVKEAMPFRAGSFVFHDDVTVRQGEDWFRGDHLRVNLKSIQRPGAESESLQPSKCVMDSSAAPVLFHVHGFDGECQSFAWSAADQDVVLTGPCRISGGEFPALGTRSADGQATSLILRAKDRFVWHPATSDTATVTLTREARIEDAQGNPLLQGNTIVFHLHKDRASDGTEAWRPTSIVADGNALLDFAPTHIAGTTVVLEQHGEAAADDRWDVRVANVSDAQFALTSGAQPGSEPGLVHLAPLVSDCVITRADGLVTITGRATVRMPVDGGADRELTADHLTMPEPSAEPQAASPSRLIADGAVVLHDPAQGVHLTADTLLLPLQGNTEAAVATGVPVHLEVPMEGGIAKIDAPRLDIDQAGGVLRGHEGAALRLPASLLQRAMASPTVHTSTAVGEALLHAEDITIAGQTQDGAFRARSLTASGGADVTSQQLIAFGDMLDLDLEQRNGRLVGSSASLAQITARSVEGRPQQTMLAPLILLEDSGKALRAPHDGVVWTWSDLPLENPGDSGRGALDPNALAQTPGARYGRLAARNDLVLRESLVTARDDVYVYVVESSPPAAKEYHVRCDAADADLVREPGLDGKETVRVSRIVAMGSVRLQSTDIKGRADVLTLKFRPDVAGHSELHTLFAEGRGRPCWIEHLGREMFTKSVLYDRITQALEGEDLRLVGSSP